MLIWLIFTMMINIINKNKKILNLTLLLNLISGLLNGKVGRTSLEMDRYGVF